LEKAFVSLVSLREHIVQRFPETDKEFWCARDLQELLGYAEWRSFSKVVGRAITSCENAGYEPTDHFGGITKMVDLDSGAKREITDIALSR
jgi:DNA-damage-inducible protein D